MDLNKFIGSKIKSFRESRDMTQDDLADLLNTTRQSISRYENGERKANQDLLFELASIFKVSLDDFFPEREFPKKISQVTPEFSTIQRKAQSLSQKDQQRLLKIMEATFDDLDNNSLEEDDDGDL